MSTDSIDSESWLIDTGDDIVRKIADADLKSLKRIEHAVYCFWVLDYAVRNSGTLFPIEDIHPEALSELRDAARASNWPLVLELTSMDEPALVEEYYERFEATVSEVRVAYESDI